MQTRISEWARLGAGILLIGSIGFGLDGCRRSAPESTSPPVQQETRAETEPAPTDGDDGIAVSLKVLAEQTGAAKADKPLGGMTRVLGYILDPANHDVILVGKAEPNDPALVLDDLIVALRSAFEMYIEEKNGTRWFTPPGVSIDPDPQTLTTLHEIQRRAFQHQDFQDIRAGLKEWKDYAQSPQKTRILGMPSSHLAKAALDADYDMKRIVNGSVKIPGVTSLTDLRKQEFSGTASSSLDRFWFVAKPDPTFREDEGIVLMEAVPVALETEAEMLLNRHSIAGSGKSDPLAQKFTAQFSGQFGTIARRSPYTELEAGFRWVCLATLMKQKDVFAQSGLSSDFFLKDYSLPTVTVPATLPGIAAVEDDISKQGNVRHFRVSLMVGGVDMSVAVSQTNVQQDASGRLHRLSSAVRQARPATPSPFWTFRAEQFRLLASAHL